MEAKRPRKFPLHKMIPNMITLAAMAAGMTSIKLSIVGKWEHAVIAIVAAAFMDAFDGAAARLLKAQSKLGAELDSFSDFICFGVAPALVVYQWSLHEIPRWGWPIALIFAMAVALRLARFNIATDEKDPNDPLSKYFTGVPSPLGAGLAILPMIVSFQLSDDPASKWDAIGRSQIGNPHLIGLWLLIVAAMMVSNMPTFSTKQVKVSEKMKVPVLAFAGILIVCLINEPWPTLTLMGVVYLTALPFGLWHYNKKAEALSKGVKDPDDDDE
jgi:CDP-diacylglycerol--serine O-phosphatidyltransferase